MPRNPCEAGHDWSLPHTIRKVAESGRIIRLMRVKECLACGKQVEIFDEPRINYPAQGRIKTYD